MKSLLTYYSYSGNTTKVIDAYSGILKKYGQVTVQRLKPKDEITSFIGQCNAAFYKKRAVLDGNIIYDASEYDLIVVGSPVWAFAPVPAINAYLDKLQGLNGKKAIVLLTSGSGVGVKRCFKNIRTVLEGCGAASIAEVNVPDSKQKNADFISAGFIKALEEAGIKDS